MPQNPAAASSILCSPWLRQRRHARTTATVMCTRMLDCWVRSTRPPAAWPSHHPTVVRVGMEADQTYAIERAIWKNTSD